MNFSQFEPVTQPFMSKMDCGFRQALVKVLGLLAVLPLFQACTTGSHVRGVDSDQSLEMPWQEQMQIDELFLKKANQAPSKQKSKPPTSASL